jgi:thermostable 8-oxoguanine DNA glycosylase
MTKERKKRFYPKRGDYVVEKGPISYKPVSKGRTPTDDSEWTAEAIKGIECGTYKNANHAALIIAKRNGGTYINANKNRIAGKIRNILRSRQT